MRGTPEIASKKTHSIFHGMGFFRPVSFVFCHFLMKKMRKTPRPDASIIPQQETSGNYNRL